MDGTDNKKPAGSGGLNQKLESTGVIRSAALRERTQLCAGFESDRFDRANFHRLPRVRIVAIARRANGHREGAKTDERNFLVSAQAALDAREDSFDRTFRGGIRRAVAQNFPDFSHE
jgi:hypothetical protein